MFGINLPETLNVSYELVPSVLHFTGLHHYRMISYLIVFVRPISNIFCVYRHMSPHMVNVHQFYPEITFSLDKGSVGEVVETPRSAGARPGVTKSSSKIDLKVRVLELCLPFYTFMCCILQRHLKVGCIFRRQY